MSRLAELIRKKAQLADPQGYREIVAAQQAAADAPEVGSIFLTDIGEIKTLFSEVLDGYIADTTIQNPKGLDGLREVQVYSLTERTFQIDLGRKAHLLNRIDEGNAKDRVRNAMYGADGNGGLCGTVVFKRGGRWMLADYEFDTSYATVTKTVVNRTGEGDDGDIGKRQAPAADPEVLLLNVELVEVSGAPKPTYDNSTRIQGVREASPEMTLMMSAIKEVLGARTADAAAKAAITVEEHNAAIERAKDEAIAEYVRIQEANAKLAANPDRPPASKRT